MNPYIENRILKVLAVLSYLMLIGICFLPSCTPKKKQSAAPAIIREDTTLTDLRGQANQSEKSRIAASKKADSTATSYANALTHYDSIHVELP